MAEDKKAKKAKEETKELKEEVKSEPLNPTLQKKKERREAKAARKAANQAEEKKSRPSNVLLAVLIFGVLILMFVFIGGYNYFSKPASIEKYIEDNGGEDVYGSMLIDAYTTAAITADDNNMHMDLSAETEDKEVIDDLKDYYGGDDGEKHLKQLGAYFLTSIKPQTRGFGGSVDVKMSLNGDEIGSVDLTYREAKKVLKEAEEEAEEEAEDAEDIDADDLIDSEDIEIVDDGEDAVIVEDEDTEEDSGE